MTVSDPAVVAERFLQAIVWGEHVTVWEMLSEPGREHVLEAGGRRGLDPLQAQRIRQGTSPQDELDSFLTGLVHGLRVDFAAVPLGDVRAEPPTLNENASTIEVQLHCPATFGHATAGGDHWAAGSIVLSRPDNTDGAADSWLVDRVNPLVSRSE